MRSLTLSRTSGSENSFKAFVDMLNEMRFGRVNAATRATFMSLSRNVFYDDGIEPTDLCVASTRGSMFGLQLKTNRFPTRAEVLAANEARLSAIPNEGRPFAAVDLPGVDENGIETKPAKMESLLRQLVAPEHIVLKVNLQYLTHLYPVH